MRTSDNPIQPQFVAKPGYLEVVMCAATALVYFGVLSFGFVYDDEITIVGNAALRSWQCVPDAFVSTFAALPFYRPLTVLWLRVNYALFGLNAAWWHLAALACHVVITYLVFLLVFKLARDRGTAFAAGILFGLYPLHAENVAWLSAANDLLMTVFVLGSFLSFLTYRESRRWHWLAVSAGLFAAALLTKEPAAVFPAFIFAFVWTAEAEAGHAARARLGKALRQTAVYAGVLVAYVGARSLASGNLAPGKMVSLSWTTMMLTWPSVLWFDLRHLFLPVGSSEFYGLDYVVQPTFRAFALPLLLLAAMAGVVIVWTGKLQDRRLARFACLWILLPLLPTLYLRALTPGDFVHDRFLYLPSVGFVLLVALTVRQFRGKLFGISSTAIQGGAVVCLAAAFVAGAVSYQLPFASDILLYQNGLKFVPESSNLKDNLANAFLGKGELEPAIRLYLEVLAKNPRYWRSNYNLGYAYYKIGEYPRAETYLNRAIQIDSSDPDQFIYLALTQLRLGRPVDATGNAERAIQRGPQSPGYHYALGMILEARGDSGRAMTEFQSELNAHPENGSARNELQRLRLLSTP